MAEESKMDVVDEVLELAVSRAEKDTMPWVEKYRPKSLNELIAHEEIIHILNKLIESNKLPHLLFYGPPGTGLSPSVQMIHNNLTMNYGCYLELFQERLLRSWRVQRKCTESTTPL